ncbi:hypothetical protein BGP75_01950 [Motiliproteus sp. MSK22-1]|nr:hypothetical protein BGP75_01950 [Motiliproteus sp. MSK22-1]
MVFLGLHLMTSAVMAEGVFSGTQTIELVDSKGIGYPIGRVIFSPSEPLNGSEGSNDQAVGYQLILDHHRFQDHFLSMKEMKCLEGPELWCHIPYPYKNPRIVNSKDQRWLEHDLLFLFKRNAEFGANFWNGIYYKLSVNNGQLTGTAHALDLNMLASPPDNLDQPPVSEFDLEEADLAKRWLPRLVIRKRAVE